MLEKITEYEYLLSADNLDLQGVSLIFNLQGSAMYYPLGKDSFYALGLVNKSLKHVPFYLVYPLALNQAFICTNENMVKQFIFHFMSTKVKADTQLSVCNLIEIFKFVNSAFNCKHYNDGNRGGVFYEYLFNYMIVMYEQDSEEEIGTFHNLYNLIDYKNEVSGSYARFPKMFLSTLLIHSFAITPNFFKTILMYYSNLLRGRRVLQSEIKQLLRDFINEIVEELIYVEFELMLPTLLDKLDKRISCMYEYMIGKSDDPFTFTPNSEHTYSLEDLHKLLQTSVGDNP